MPFLAYLPRLPHASCMSADVCRTSTTPSPVCEPKLELTSLTGSLLNLPNKNPNKKRTHFFSESAIAQKQRNILRS